MTPAPVRLTAKPLTAEAFAAYGQVLEMPAQAGRHDFAARLVNGRASAKPNLALIRVEPMRLPLTIYTVESHPASSQAFVPLVGGCYLMVVMRRQPAGGPDLANARAFVATERQAINYDAGAWHVGMTVLDRPTTSAWLSSRTAVPMIVISSSWNDPSSSMRLEPSPAAASGNNQRRARTETALRWLDTVHHKI